MPEVIAAFGEDSAHRQVVGALIRRVAAELGIQVELVWRRARGGHGKVATEVAEYLRDIQRQGDWPDLVVIATDANCLGSAGRARQIPTASSPVPTVLAIPDPHIERWLLLDGKAFKKVLGQGCNPPDQKCARDRYKEALLRAIENTGVAPALGGIEFAEEIVEAMDLDRAARSDPSLKRFLAELRRALKK